MISVLMITYKQENFIAQAIEGVLRQKTNFPFHLFIGDDASPDETAQIVNHYRNLYPDQITYIRNKVNLGMMPNFIQLYAFAKTKYIALCEGDDYWVDENKLQKQIDFLEMNSGFSICFHAVNELDEKNKLTRSRKNIETQEHTYSIEDLATDNMIHTPSVVFRNGLFTDFPEWYKFSPVGDYVLHMLNARSGLIKYFPERMAIYRVHNGGVWSGLSVAMVLERWLVVLNNLSKEGFGPLVNEKLFSQKRKYMVEHLRLLMKETNWQAFLQKLELYSKDDEYISQKWLIQYYPNYIKSLKGSKTYRVALFFQKVMSKFKK